MTTTPKYTFINRQVIDIVDIEDEAIFISFSSLGGKRGWLVYNCLWRLRGIIDKIMGGVGFRGRKHPILLNMGDVVDFWRVADIQKNKRLLLKAEMKVP